VDPATDLPRFEGAAGVLESAGRKDESIACWTALIRRHPSGAAYRGRAGALARRGLPGLARADTVQACAFGERDACGELERG
jgi:hypothetical protein